MCFRKLTAAAVAILFSSSGFCAINANQGFYVGADLTAVHYERPQGSAIGYMLNFFPQGMVRPVIGFRFNDFWALEAGYNNVENVSRDGNSYWGPDRLRIYTYDLAVKGVIPFESGFSLFAKAGAGLTHQYVYNVVLAGDPPETNYTLNRIQPLLGVGTSFNFTKNIAGELIANYYFRNGKVGAIALVGLGMTYTFGDL